MAAGALVFLAGCSGDDATGSGDQESAAAAAPASVTLAPADGAADVSPVEPLEISVTDGELAEVTVTDGAGAQVTGAVADSAENPDAEVWTPETPLAYGTSYTLTAVATNADDEEADGVGDVHDRHPHDGARRRRSARSTAWSSASACRSASTSTTRSPTRPPSRATCRSRPRSPTDGVWSWMNDSEVHFRPSEYWPANTEITLDANLYGVDFGDGIWGEKDRTVSFTVGDRHVSIADAGNHTLQVYDGDQLVQTFPMSAGGPDFPSRNGPHVVTELNRDRVMDSSTYGVPVDSPNGYRTPVEYAVRLSNNGEFVHAAPWSVAQQGNENVSHGCINLSTDRAAWFFNFSQPGDVVEIRNSIGPTLSAADGDIYDWAISWDEWQAGSALK